jgi:N-ethylmaleimide reductase
MTQDDIDATVDEYARAAVLAVEQAGLDGIELHGANGYLIEQFLNLGANQRTDRWGGTVDGRIRFAVEVARRCVAAIGADRVGIRLSPYGETNGSIPDADTDELYLTLADELSRLGLVYLHLVDHSTWGRPSAPPELVTRIRDTFGGALILSGGYDLARANADLAAHRGDLIAFGRPALANPDLLPRLRHGTPLNHPDTATFYTDGPTGYTDYPTAE